MESCGFYLYFSELFPFRKKKFFFLEKKSENTNYHVSIFFLYNLGKCPLGIFLFFLFFLMMKSDLMKSDST